jgi:glycosyltransferase involved in cell wall biosynthesis
MEQFRTTERPVDRLSTPAGSVRAECDQLPLAVVIPAYNRSELLDHALRSVTDQSRQPSEIIVVDDCSEDDTGAVARARGARVIRHETNRGPSAARNTGMRATEQPWVAFLDCDDDWLPHHLQTLWDARAGHVLVGGSGIAWNPDLDVPTRVYGPLTRRPRVLENPRPLLFPENFIVESGVLVRRDVALAVGGYDERRRHSEDLELWVKLLSLGSAVVLPEVTLRYRVHPLQAVSARDTMRASHLEVLAASELRNDGPLQARIEAVSRWDRFREAQRDGDRRAALEHWLWLARPRRLMALFDLLWFRHRSRRRAFGFDRDGRPSVAVLGGSPGPPASLRSSRVLDLRKASLPRQLAAVLMRPPGRVVVGKRWQQRLLGLLGVSAGTAG